MKKLKKGSKDNYKEKNKRKKESKGEDIKRRNG